MYPQVFYRQAGENFAHARSVVGIGMRRQHNIDRGSGVVGLDVLHQGRPGFQGAAVNHHDDLLAAWPKEIAEPKSDGVTALFPVA